MRKLIFLFTILCFSDIVFAQTSQSLVQFDKPIYHHGDTINFSCYREKYINDNLQAATVYLLIENIDTKKHWTYRYPVLQGKMNASLFIDSAIEEGKYAFTFVFRKNFFSIRGKADFAKNAALNYSVMTKYDDARVSNINTDANGNFLLRNILFEDTSYFVFSRTKETDVPLHIQLQTILDSSFVSDTVCTRILSVGTKGEPTIADAQYRADLSNFNKPGTLPEVVVKTTAKRKVDLFNEEYSTGLFRNADAILFDGIEDTKISSSRSVLEFLKSRVPGLVISNSGSTGYRIEWRGEPVDLYLDEFKATVLELMISPMDVAMIKVFRPPSYLSPASSRGAIAVYSKRGIYSNDSTGGYNFRIFGYTPAGYTWL